MTGLLLAFDTATPVGSVALGRGAEVLAHATLDADARHAETLLPAVDALLRGAGVAPAALAGVVVGGGPGSFTGVRIAAATAKGMVRALGVPLYAHSSLLALAAGAAHASGEGWTAAWVEDAAEESGTAAGAGDVGAVPGGPAVAGGAGLVCALLDARRGEVYAGCWRFAAARSPAEVLAPTVAPVGEVVAALAAEAPLWAGQGAERYATALGEAAHIATGRQPDARALLRLTALDPAACRVAEPAGWEPAYLRASGAERGVRG